MLTLSLGLPLPLLAIQVLCLNLVTNGISDIALATERSHQGILLEKPLPANMKVVSPNTYPYIILMTLTMTALGFWIYLNLFRQWYRTSKNNVFPLSIPDAISQYL